MSSGIVAVRGRAAVVEPGGVGEQVGDAPEVGFRPDGQLEGRDAGAEPVAQLVEGALEVGPLAVELVDEDHPGHVELGRRPPHRLGLHLARRRPRDTTNTARSATRSAACDVADEVGVARRVDEVDLVALPLERGHRQGEREAPACSSGSWSQTVVPSSTRPSRLVAPAQWSSASASVVLPDPPWPTRATLRIFSGGKDILTSRLVASGHGTDLTDRVTGLLGDGCRLMGETPGSCGLRCPFDLR